MLNIKRDRQKDDHWNRLKHPFAAGNPEILRPKFQPVNDLNDSFGTPYDQELEQSQTWVTVPHDVVSGFFNRSVKKATIIGVQKLVLESLYDKYDNYTFLPAVAYRKKRNNRPLAAVIPSGLGEIAMGSGSVLSTVAIAQAPKPTTIIATIALVSENMDTIIFPPDVGALRKDRPIEEVHQNFPDTPIIRIKR